MIPLLAALSAAVAPPHAVRNVTSQNVLVLVLDDVGTGLISAYDDYWHEIGRPSATPARTPAIDELIARRGLTFTNAWSPPVCTPSRSCLLTGKWGPRTGMGAAILERENIANPGLTAAESLLPQYLHGAPTPYMCVALGKWHLADRYQMQDDPMHPLGEPAGTWFDRYAGAIFNLSKIPGVPLTQCGYWTWMKHYSSYVQLSVNPCDVGEPPCDVERDANTSVAQYPTVDTIEDALAVVQELPEPWFLYVATNAIHAPVNDTPFGAPTTVCDTYALPQVECDYPNITLAQKRARCMLEALDGQIGRLLCTIDLSNTTVIVLGDNGTARKAVVDPYKESHAKTSVYQGGIEVPLIVRSPLLDPSLVGQRTDALVAVVDIFATVLELAQIDPQTTAGVDSVSFLPCLTTPGATPRSLLYTDTFTPNFVPDPNTANGLPPGYFAKRHDQAVRDARFKLIRKWRRDHTTGLPYYIEELYDLQQGGEPDGATVPPTPTPDWMEENNLLSWTDPLPIEAQQSLAALRAELDLNHPTVMQ